MIHFYSSNRPRLPRVFRLIGYAGIAFGILAIILQFSSASPTSADQNNTIVTIVFASLLLIGFSYLVEAAIFYIEEHQSKNEINSAMGT